MDVPTKIRLLNTLRKAFPKWATRRQALVIERAFDADLANAKDWEARQSILQRRDFEAAEYWDQLAQLRSQELVTKAITCHAIHAGKKGTA